MRQVVFALCVYILCFRGSSMAEELQVIGPAECRWFSDSLAARSGISVVWTSGQVGPGTSVCRLSVNTDLAAKYRTQISSNLVELSGKDRLGLTYACLDFLDSVSEHSLSSYLHPSKPLSWEFTPKTSERIVMLNQRADNTWPKARSHLYNAIYAGRASEVLISGFSMIWRPQQAQHVDEMLSICDQYGLKARFITATFTKWWYAAVPTSRCLCASIPTRLRRIPPDPEKLLDPRLYANRPLVAQANDSNRAYLNVDFPHADDNFRLWQVTYKLRADDSTSHTRASFMWYRNPKFADPNTDGVEVWTEYPLLTSWLTFRDTINSLEQLHWTAHFECLKGRMWLDSVRIAEINPFRWDTVSCTCDTLESGWYRYQKAKASAYLSPLTMRPERDSSMIEIGITMDSCFARFHHHPSFVGFFSSCDEVYVSGWDTVFKRTYANASDGYVDLLRKIARKSRDLFTSSRLLFYGDMLDPYHNAKVFTRACSPRGGGFKNTRHYAEPDTSLLDILFWGENDPRICRALADTFHTGWTWTAGITIGHRQKENSAWEPLHPTRVCYFDWGDQFYTPAVLRDLKDRWYR